MPPADTPSVAAPLGLYLHVPFCERKCPYCDFNTYAGLSDWFDRTVTALCHELAQWQTPLAGRTVTSVFVGGGTPTVLDEAGLTRLFDQLRRSLTLADDCEITCEANPGTVDRPKFALLRALGVNRLSVGVQSFQPSELGFLGRIHDDADAVRAFETARLAGFDNINLDFMFGLPHQDPAAWDATLTQALTLAPEHLSLYSLIVEPNTPLQHWVATGQTDAPDDDHAALLYETAMARLAAAGYVHYEVSNWAKPGAGELPATHNPGYACRHNLLYWRNQEYIGIGPGAHSHLRIAGADAGPDADPLRERPVGKRWSNRKPVPGYVKRVLADAPDVADMTEVLTPRMAMGETMMLGLRLVREGVAFDRFAARHGVELREVFRTEIAKLAAWGLVTLDERSIRLTPPGLMVGNQVFAEFLAD